MYMKNIVKKKISKNYVSSLFIFFCWKLLRALQYKNKNDELHEKLKTAEFEVNDLLQTNQVNFLFFINDFYQINLRYFEKNFKL